MIEDKTLIKLISGVERLERQLGTRWQEVIQYCAENDLDKSTIKWSLITMGRSSAEANSTCARIMKMRAPLTRVKTSQ